MIDRDAAARLGITVSQIDNTLYDAFGQRQVSTIYVARNQYHVIMEVAPRFWQNPETLKDVYVSTSGGSVGGSQATNAVAGTVVAAGVCDATPPTPRPPAISRPIRSARPARACLDRFGGSTNAETMIPLVHVRELQAGRDAAGGQSSGPAGRQHHFVQPAAGVSLSAAVGTIEQP